MIIDAHCHLGHDVVFDLETDGESILGNMNRHGIDGAVIQPAICRPYIEDTRKLHDEIHTLCMQKPGLLYGLASINPHFRREDYDNEAKRCMNELGFIGLKLTPIGHAVNPLSKDGLHVIEVAARLGVAVMIHTGLGIPDSDPAKIFRIAKDFPGLKLIMAHAGMNFYTQQAIDIAMEFENVYLEPSGAGINATKAIIDAVGVNKVMFSTDTVLQTPAELYKYRTLIEDQVDLDRVLSGTAEEAFGLSGKISKC